MSKTIIPFSLKDAPSLIEHLFPVQKISAEAYKEQMAGAGKTLAPLGSYWKGRKPLVLNRACILGSLMPATADPYKDLEIFDLLMGMDDLSLKKRLQLEPTEDLPDKSYRELVADAKRPEEMGEPLYDHVWERVNQHLGTDAHSSNELVEQLGIMRFGHRPKIGDNFCGSGQIPFEAGRLGCDVFASDLNPIACLQTWGAFNIVGALPDKLASIKEKQIENIKKISKVIDQLEIERDGTGWRAKAFLYCVEARCPQTGWMVPLLPSFVLSKQRTGDKFNAICELKPDPEKKSYNIEIKTCVSEEVLSRATKGSVRTDGRGQDPYMIHVVEGREYRTKISTLRGDFEGPDGSTKNRLRAWDKHDFAPRADDIFQERLYAIQWIKEGSGRSEKYEFRAASPADLDREKKVIEYLSTNFEDWQNKGYLPAVVIEKGVETERLTKEKGWTYWHHLFTPRQLLIAGLANQTDDPASKLMLCQLLNWNSRLSGWNPGSGGGGSVQPTFYNMALNTLMSYASRSFKQSADLLEISFKEFPLRKVNFKIRNIPAADCTDVCDIWITDPPYGEVVRYEEILDFFIAWLKGRADSPPLSEFIWDSRKSLAIAGDGDDFKQKMIAAYQRAAKNSPENSVHVIMFTHQSSAIWAEMANIVWAAGLSVQAAWYVVTEAEKRIQGNGAFVTGTILLILKKAKGGLKSSRDDIAWEIQEEVDKQLRFFTELNSNRSKISTGESLFEDADLQMAGYAAALRVLTKYSIIDGREMVTESVRPRVRGQTTFVDSLIDFAVSTANQALIPEGLSKQVWERLLPAERFLLKMIDLESKGLKTLDNYQNFSKAFKIRDFAPFMQSHKANEARLKGAVEFGKTDMSEGSELYLSTLRAIYYAIMELHKDTDTNEVLQHLSFNVKDYYTVPTQREMVIAISEYLAKKLETLRPTEASSARVLAELVRNQRLG